MPTDRPTTSSDVPLDPWTAGPTRPPDRRRRLVAVGGGVVAAVLIGGGAFVGVSGASSGASGYRTAVVSTTDVERTLSGVGTIEAVDQAAVAFPVSGTVATVEVSTGTEVVAGQVLATLDTTELERSLHEAQATSAEAELTLEKVLAGESTGTSGTGSTPSSGSSDSSDSSVSSGTPSGSSSPSSETSGSDTSGTDTAARQAVADAQHTLDVDLAAAQAALDASGAACGSSSAATPMSTAPSSSTTSTTVAASGTEACQDALVASLAAQQTVAADEGALQEAINALEAIVSAASSSSSSSSSSGTSSSGSGSTGSTGSTDSSSSSSVSAADIVAAQKAVDAAAAEVSVAEQSVAQAAIVTPISGTVSAVNFEVGDAVAAASTTATIRVVGSGGFEVTTSVAVTDLPHVEVGETATVMADGSTTALAASVVQIGLVPTSGTSGSATTYPVVLALSDPAAELLDGGLTSVRIVTGTAEAVTAVPTSAVTTNEIGHTVVVLDDGVSTVDVEVGTIGSTWTEITSGVEVGDTVVLADLSAALPGSATSASSGDSSSTARTGSFPSGFTPPAGAGGGPPGN
jgi:multidrug efflux pump subunit AcrA (membrane-fusion protein)